MRVNASTIEHVFSNLGAVKYCILHQIAPNFQAHPVARCRLELLEGGLADAPVAHVAPRERRCGAGNTRSQPSKPSILTFTIS
jgi:hypothetical protein